jgi:hypothetical protein
VRKLVVIAAAWLLLSFGIGLVTTHAQFNGCPSGFCSPRGGAPSEATVLIDVANVPGPSSLSVTVGAFPGALNVGSGPNGTANMVLTAALMFCNAAAGTSNPTLVQWDAAGTPQTMTRLTGISPGAVDHIGNGSAGDIYYYYQINPTLGSKQLSVTWTGNNQLIVALASFVNVDQTGGSTTFPNAQAATGTGSVPTVSISSSPTTRKFTGAFMSGTTNFTTTGSTAYTGSPANTCNTAATASAWDAGTVTSLSYSPSSAGAWAALGVVLKGN